MTETQERFLRSVLTRVPLDDIVELHLFPPIRRGTMETGVAVIATLLPPVPLAVVDADAPVSADPNTDALDTVPADVNTTDQRATDDTATDDDATDDDAAAVIQAADGAAPMVAAHDTENTGTEAGEDDESPYADEPVAATGRRGESDHAHADMQLVDDDASGLEATESPAAPAPRLRILTAAYRHTVKGIDRGKWVVDVQEEADAPLAAVEAVLRGVRQRSTEPADPELVSPQTLAALLAPTRVAPAA
jgi:hypothetical protein